MPTFEETVEFIKNAHAGQRYGQVSYWTHPVAVAQRLPTDDEELKIIALLHDVVEDTPYGIECLRLKGYSERVLSALELLTKKEGETYEQYMYRLTDGFRNAPEGFPNVTRLNIDALLVKLADNAENSSEDNLQLLPEARQAKLREKYQYAKGMIMTTLNAHTPSAVASTEIYGIKVSDIYD